jgi:hypothetical protein
MRRRFREVIAVTEDDGITFDPDGVRASIAEHDVDGYDGVKVKIRAHVGQTQVDLQVDVGFGDAVVPPASRTSLETFLDSDEPARVYAYQVPGVVAEKVETIVSKFPAIKHRLKDILDVAVLADVMAFDGAQLVESLEATFERRTKPVDVKVLDEMPGELAGREWERAWATMCKDKMVSTPIELREAIEKFDAFARPLLVAIAAGKASMDSWEPGGPWSVGPGSTP